MEQRYRCTMIPADGIRLVFGRDRLPEYQRTCPAWPTEGQVEGRRRAAFSRFTNKARADAIAFLAAHPDYQPIQRPGWRWPGLEGIAWNKWGGWI